MAGKTNMISELAVAAGWEAALLIVQFAGGQSRWFPVKPTEEHWLTALVGPDAAEKLCKIWGGGYVQIPKGADDVVRFRNHQIRDERRRGTIIRELAAKYRLTERQIYNVLGSVEE